MGVGSAGKTSQVYSCGLSELDYELRAENKGVSSPTKTLSSFDSRKNANINLKVK
jgi:hypothetical protein